MAATVPAPAAEGIPEVYWGDRWLLVFWLGCAGVLAGMIFVSTCISLLRSTASGAP
jgi:hypothetical protein